MSKGTEGPAASTFTSPRKTGWLYKHGGSGFSSHWKKRWFIADHHYLFYYKGPNEKKPVGILCLPEYGSCQKADVKEWKKPFSFILSRPEGIQESVDQGSNNAAGKDYILYSDSEGDMNAWIKALQEEMKPAGHFANGPTGSGSAISVDQKALDMVTKAASDGPKLSHPTAQRPRVRGRRPPKRYATYHEEDKDESPPTTPPAEHKESTTPPQPLSPSPSASPTTQKKGHRPVVPLMPKQRSLTSSPPLPRESPKSTKKLPPPPPVKPSPEREGVVEIAPVPKQRPVPPKRPTKPRATTDVPVPAPRPVPVPRKVIMKEVAPQKELPDEIKEEEQVIAERLLVVSEQEPESLNLGQDAGKEPVEDRPDEQQVSTDNERENGGEVEEENPEPKSPAPTQEAHPTTDGTAIPSLPETTQQTTTEREDKNMSETTPPPSPAEKSDTHAVAVHPPTETTKEELLHPSAEGDSGVRSALTTSTDFDYEPMRSGITKDAGRSHKEVTKSPEYEEPAEWHPDSSDGGDYAVPRPASKQEVATYDIPKSVPKVTVGITSPTPQISVVATVKEESLTTGRGKAPSPPPSSGNEEQLKPFRIERDSLWYTKVMKQKSGEKRVCSESPMHSDEEPPPPPLWTGMDLPEGDVPTTLHQAREILRLAKVMKQEAEDMRQEAQRELEMARREKHDAELIKKNATEILRMAKEKLHANPPS